jgi:RNA binding exosome subunit
MPSAIEVTIYVPFVLEPRNDDERMIAGIAEIFGNENTYEVITLRGKDGNRIDWNTETFRRVRSELLFSQHVYDTLKETLYWTGKNAS